MGHAANCERCISLTRQLRETQEELAEWRGRGDFEPDNFEVDAQKWRLALGVAPQRVRVALYLTQRAGETVSLDRLCRVLWDEDRLAMLEMPVRGLQVVVYHLRERFRALFDAPLIETVHGYGLTLSKRNAERLTAYVAEAEAKRAAA